MCHWIRDWHIRAEVPRLAGCLWLYIKNGWNTVTSTWESSCDYCCTTTREVSSCGRDQKGYTAYHVDCLGPSQKCLPTCALNGIVLNFYASDLNECCKIIQCYDIDVIFSLSLNNVKPFSGFPRLNFLTWLIGPLLDMAPGSLRNLIFLLSLKPLLTVSQAHWPLFWSSNMPFWLTIQGLCL